MSGLREAIRTVGRRGARRARREARELATSRVPGLRSVGSWFAEGLASRTPRLFPLDEVLAVLEALRLDEIPVWLGGGWGVDALYGCQSRFHTDLELVVPDLVGDGRRVLAALRPLGFEQQQRRETGIWWETPSLDLRSPSERIIEVLSINWTMLGAIGELLGAGPRSALHESWATTGSLGGTVVPCLSSQAQRLFHLGYPARQTDEWDLALLDDQPVAASSRTSLVLPVFPFDDWSYRVWREVGPALRIPHVTLLHPFLPGALVGHESVDVVAGIAGDVQAFDLDLTEVGWFGDRVVYLRPHPVDPIVGLIGRIVEAFPQCRPYEGQFDEVVPHLTIAEGGPSWNLRHAATISRSLPLRAWASEIWLVDEGSGRPLRRFPLGAWDRSVRSQVARR